MWHTVRFHWFAPMRSFFSLVCGLSLLMSFDAAAAAAKKRPAVVKKKPIPVVPGSTDPEPAAAATDPNQPKLHGPTRIDFDDRLIQGQSNKSGSVYLYDRKELKIRSMLKKRENFRDEILDSLNAT
jgi:hypothetical protein